MVVNGNVVAKVNHPWHEFIEKVDICQAGELKEFDLSVPATKRIFGVKEIVVGKDCVLVVKGLYINVI